MMQKQQKKMMVMNQVKSKIDIDLIDFSKWNEEEIRAWMLEKYKEMQNSDYCVCNKIDLDEGYPTGSKSVEKNGK